jgi:hypothetical protein
MTDDKRHFERYNLDIPILMKLGDVAYDKTEYLNNISLGGLSFKSTVPVKDGTVIEITIPLVRPVFRVKGKVTRCEKKDDHYDIGVSFSDKADAFKIRMVEQICHIEKYKAEIDKKEGRKITGEQAALEWIRKFAAHFPKLKEYCD